MSVRTILLVALIACTVPQEPETEVTITEGISFATLGRGILADVGDAEIVVRDAAVWSAYADSLRPLAPFDSVRFEQEMVLLVSLQVPASGYDLRIEALERTTNEIIVEYRVYEPGEDCRNTVGEGTIFHAVRLPRSAHPLRFVAEHETLRCTKP